MEQLQRKCGSAARADSSAKGETGLEGNRIAFLTRPDSRKARNLERDPRVAISITDRNQPYTMAQVRGRVIARLEGAAALAVIDRISHKYKGQPYPMRTDRVVFLIEPERVGAGVWMTSKRKAPLV